MRNAEFGILAVLIVGVFLVLAFGFKTSETPAVDGVALATPGGDSISSDIAVNKEPVVSAAVDFSQGGEYVLDVAKLTVANGTLTVATCCGSAIGTFRMDGSGKVVPTGAQPDGNIVKSAYSGPPGDNRSTYRVYPAGYAKDSSAKPYLAVDFSGGNVTVTPGSDITRTHAKTFTGKRAGYGGSVAGSGGDCATSGGG